MREKATEAQRSPREEVFKRRKASHAEARREYSHRGTEGTEERRYLRKEGLIRRKSGWQGGSKVFKKRKIDHA